MNILIITTGGTIGALPHPDPRNCPSIVSMPPDGKDLVREAVSKDFTAFSTRCLSFEPRDSKFIDDAYRQDLVAAIDAAPEISALVTHGTDTILQTAEYFYQVMSSGFGLKNKAVVLTGSMVPLTNGPESDGYLNMKFALGQLASGKLYAGVYIVLCDYAVRGKKESWQPQFYPFTPGRYDKDYNPEDTRYSRLRMKA